MQRFFQLLPLLLLILAQFSYCLPGDNEFWKALADLTKPVNSEAASNFLKTGRLPSEAGSSLSATGQRVSAADQQVSAAVQQAQLDRQPQIVNSQPFANSVRTSTLKLDVPPLRPEDRLEILKQIGDAFGGDRKTGLHPYAGDGELLSIDLIQEAFGTRTTHIGHFEDDIFVVPSKKTKDVPKASMKDGRMELTGPRERHLYVWKRIEPSGERGSIFQLVGAVETDISTGSALSRLRSYSVGRSWGSRGVDTVYDSTLLLAKKTEEQLVRAGKRPPS